MENKLKEMTPLENSIRNILTPYKSLIHVASTKGGNTITDKPLKEAIAKQTYTLLNKLPDLHAETSNETLKGAISEVLNQTTTEFTSINKLIEEEATKLFEYPKFFQTKSGQALELFINEFESYYTSKLQALQKEFEAQHNK
ncbi:hypothetical protein JDS92_01545 [Bacillus cereus group sp. N12]|uniref:hypothetical protein n=1 Tax=Bacillus cereus group sp. N12 TaxID=2794586 RepID=UPI0018F57397|nr:hypothetical protein [Bacillus cereus group sp. N12]MBJ8074037.1 hypothetical protein [Bacillus cereus group sp. N12]